MMFAIDKQTINDLELFERSRHEKSVFSLFSHTLTSGGKKQLELFFSNPITDIDLLEQRIQVLRYFQTFKPGFGNVKESFDFIEYYFLLQNIPGRFSVTDTLLKAFRNQLKPGNEYYIIQRGIRYLVQILVEMYETLRLIDSRDSPFYIRNCREKIMEHLENSPLKVLLKFKDRTKFNPLETGRLDYLFRKSHANEVREIIEIIYEFDAFTSVVKAAEIHGLSFPEYSEEPNVFHAEGLVHPFLENAVPNNFKFEPGKNVCFLSGPNMAGKSTFLKAMGISVYLSHIGFPVPASRLRISVFNGLLTTINLPDNINKGYSHFLNEVVRVRYVAEQINLAGNLFVVFDEIFRGTNVRDACEASLAVISSLSRLRNSVFTVSTHIVEVAEKLTENNSIFFRCFDANLSQGKPCYEFKIKEGVSSERIGMYILEKEKVLETIEKGIKKGQTGQNSA